MKHKTLVSLSILAFSLLTFLPTAASAAMTVTGATVNGATSTTVIVGTPTVSLTVSGSVSGVLSGWGGTKYVFATTTPTQSSMTCRDTSPDILSVGPSVSTTTNAFSVSTPVAAGVYNLYVSSQSLPTCTGGLNVTSPIFTVANALTVQGLDQTIDFPAITPLEKTYGDAPVTLIATSTSGLSVSFSTPSASNICTVAGNTVTFTGPGSCVIDANQSGNATYAAAPTVSQTFTISPAILSVDTTGVVATKVYDATTTVSFSTLPIVTGTIGGDVMGSIIGTYDTKSVGTGKTITFSMTGVDAYKYVFATSTMLGDITTRMLNVTATGVDKVYDGTVGATVTYGDNRVVGDSLTVSGTSVFLNKHVGSTKPVIVVGITLSGVDAGNYTNNATTSTTANISKLPVAVLAQPDSKIYDATTTSSVMPALSVSMPSGDTYVAQQVYDDKNVGTSKTLTPSIVITDGNNGNNYTVTLIPQNVGTITQKTVTMDNISVVSKVYDKTTDATMSTSTTPTFIGLLAGDEADVEADFSSAVFTFTDTNAGIGKSVTVTGVTLSGTESGNYVLGSLMTTGDITPRPITITAATSTKTYDGTTDSGSIPDLTSGTLVATDTLSFTQSYADRNVGTEKTLNATGTVIDDNNGNNYAVTFESSDTGTIIPAILTVTATSGNKVYDGNTDATALVGLSDDRVSGLDTFTLSFESATFNDKNIGTFKPVTVVGIAKTGTGADNYEFATTSAYTTGDITAKELTAVVSAPSKVYDTNTSVATATCSVLSVEGDDVTCAVIGTTTFADAHAGVDKTITATEVGISGADAGNYVLTSTVATGTATITQAPITVGFTAEDKTYDGNTDAVIVLATSTGALGTDDVSVASGTAAFDTASAGNDKTVTATDFVLTGVNADDYMIDSVATTTATIFKREVSVGFTAANKVYDATTTATILTRSVLGVLEDDTVTALGGVASFEDVSVGNDKFVSADMLSFTLGGSEGDNYVIATGTATTTANITAVPPTTPTGGSVSFGSNGGFGGGSSNNSGSITSGTPIGASATSSLTCAPTFTLYMKFGKVNNKAEVLKLQKYLNKYLNLNISLTGFFGTKTLAAVKAFQAKYAADILSPWGYTKPTGYVYSKTIDKLNALICAEQGN